MAYHVCFLLPNTTRLLTFPSCQHTYPSETPGEPMAGMSLRWGNCSLPGLTVLMGHAIQVEGSRGVAGGE